MNKRQKNILVGRKPSRVVNSRKEEKKYGPSPLLSFYRKWRAVQAIRQLDEAIKSLTNFIIESQNETTNRIDT